MGNLCGAPNKKKNKELQIESSAEAMNVMSLKAGGKNKYSSVVPDFSSYKTLRLVDNINQYYNLTSAGGATKLGEGAYGIVIKAKRLEIDEWYAVKKIKKSKLEDEHLQNMMSEIQMLKTINHPHTMAVKELLHDSKYFYICTELCEGGELFDRLLDIGPFTEPNCSTVIK